jgi:heptosyltransferase-2
MKKVLIIKMSALGDVMISLPQVEAITAQHGNDEVWIMTGPQCAEFFANHPRLRVAVLDREKILSGSGAWGRVLWTRKMRFDSIYDLQGNRTSRRLVRFSGSPRRVGTQPRPVYTHAPEHPYTRDSRQNVFDRLNETLAAGGLVPASPGCHLYPGERDLVLVRRWRHDAGLEKKKYVLLHAGSSEKWLSKRWPEHSFLRLASMIEERGVHCVWVGGAEERDLNARLASEAGIDATGLFTPLQLCLLGLDALFSVTSDSGPMHILSAAGIPVFSFFGPTDWRRSHAAGQAGRVLKADIDCSPCFSGICRSPAGHLCMENIAPERVFAMVSAELPPAAARKET